MSVIAIAAMLASCGGKSSTAKKIEGSWTGMPTTVVNDSVSIDYIPTYTFIHSEGATGRVTITAMISSETTIEPKDSLGSRMWVTAAALAKIDGDYTIDDSIVFDLNPNTFEVTLDNEATRLTFDNLNPSEVENYIALRDSCAEILRAMLPTIVRPSLVCDTVLTHPTMTRDILVATSTASPEPVSLRRQAAI